MDSIFQGNLYMKKDIAKYLLTTCWKKQKVPMAKFLGVSFNIGITWKVHLIELKKKEFTLERDY